METYFQHFTSIELVQNNQNIINHSNVLLECSLFAEISGKNVK